MQNVRIFFLCLKGLFYLRFYNFTFKRSVYHLIRTWKETFTNFIYTFTNAAECLISNNMSKMAEVLWKSTLICAVLKDQYEESEVYQSNCARAYQLNLQKKHLCYVNEFGETSYRYRLLLTTETMRLRNDCFHQISRPTTYLTRTICYEI